VPITKQAVDKAMMYSSEEQKPWETEALRNKQKNICLYNGKMEVDKESSQKQGRLSIEKKMKSQKSIFIQIQ